MVKTILSENAKKKAKGIEDNCVYSLWGIISLNWFNYGVAGELMQLKYSLYLAIFVLVQSGIIAGEADTNGGKTSRRGGQTFNNGCTMPEWQRVRVPKTKEGLKIQLGAEFSVLRRGMFLIASDLDKERLDYVIDGVFACCREILEREYFHTPSSVVVTVYIFKNKNSYVDALHKYFGMEPISPYGHYGHRQRYIVVNYATGPGTLVHELTHALMAPDFPQAPIWISEGIASLYEQCRVEGESLRGEQNWRLPELKRAVTEKKLTPLAELLSSDTQMFRTMKESLNYAQSRYFCKYMEELGLLRQVYSEFRDNAVEDPTGIKTLERVFGQSIQQIERDWIEWLAGQSWRSTMSDDRTHTGN